MKYFDFFYYLIYKFYDNFNENGADGTAAIVLGGLPALNILTAIMYADWKYNQKQIYIMWGVELSLGILAVFLIPIYIRFLYKENYSAPVLEKKWLSLTKETREAISTACIMYVFGSFGSFICMAVYIGSKVEHSSLTSMLLPTISGKPA